MAEQEHFIWGAVGRGQKTLEGCHLRPFYLNLLLICFDFILFFMCAIFKKACVDSFPIFVNNVTSIGPRLGASVCVCVSGRGGNAFHCDSPVAPLLI